MNEFNIQQIENGIYKITEPFFSEHANLFLFATKDTSLLIDAGLGIGNLKAFLAANGFTPHVALTHSHFDHAGGISHFPTSSLLLTEKQKTNLTHRELWGLEYCREEFFEPGTYKTVSITVPETKASTQQSISIGTRNFEIIATPGHTDDSVCFYDRTAKILITGDTLYDGEVYADLPNSDKAAFATSLKKLAAVDFEMVLPGHNEVMDRAKALAVIEEWISRLS